MPPEPPPGGAAPPPQVGSGRPSDPAAAATSRRSRRLAVALAGGLALALVVAVVVIRERGDARRSAGRALGPSTTVASGTAPAAGPVPLPPEATGGGVTRPSEPTSPRPAGGGPGPTAAPTPAPAPATAAAPAPPPAGLRLGGNDLGVTAVGAPMAEAVAAVTGVLGRPLGDPAPDAACLGAEEEASWEGFRLGSTAGRVSGWRSTSPALSTPAGVAVGTTLERLRGAYGGALEVRPPDEPGGQPVFVVAGAALGGTLAGSKPTDAVTSISNGTCEAG